MKANWFKLLWRIKEEDLQELQGTDHVIYMKFVKYMSNLFFGIMCFNLLLLLPIYKTGSASDQFQVSDFTQLTIINVTGSPNRIWASFMLLIVNSLAALYVVYKYQKTSIELKNNLSNAALRSSEAKLTEKDVALHTVYVKNLPRELNSNET